MALTLGATDYTLLTTTTNPALATTVGGAPILILAATVCNTDVKTHRVTIWRSTGAPSTQPNMIWDAVPVDSLQTLKVPIGGQPLTNGQGLYASQDSGSGVNLNIGWAVPG